MVTRADVSAATGFDSGEQFDSSDQVRAYFTVANMMDMFGPEDGSAARQAELDEMAEAVIANGWHMRPLTVTEAAQLLGVDTSTVRHAIADGRIAATLRGRDWWITQPEAMRYSRERKPRPARPARP